MSRVVLGLDIGGANLKAATAAGRAETVPFALWKHPDRLGAVLAELVAKFPEATELAVTMTGELCDCYETKRQGVNAILDAVESVRSGRTTRIWGTDGNFHSLEVSRAEVMLVAASNWHALATFAGRFAPTGNAKLIDIGSTTADLIPLKDGQPNSRGKTDPERLVTHELVYTGVRRTPICAVVRNRRPRPFGLIAAELFATTLDAYLVLGLIAEDPNDTDTADGRAATIPLAKARLARMVGGDTETIPEATILALATEVETTQLDLLAAAEAADGRESKTYLLSGAGEFLARSLFRRYRYGDVELISLAEKLGPVVSTCAPAYALAVLGTERRP